MSWIMVDIEADGPIPGDYSMIELGAVIVEPSLSQTFHGRLQPISDRWVPSALAVSGHSREETLEFSPPAQIMLDFSNWLQQHSHGKPRFIADNNGFDWMFCCWYFHHFLGKCPMGFSSANLGSLFKGLQGDMFASFKYLRRTKHTHNPVDDAMGNAEALLHMKEHMDLRISLK